MRTFTFTDDKSNKFWNINLQGNAFTVTFGKIGTAGQTQIKDYPNEATAQKEHDKLVAEKLKKGYVETSSPTATAAPAPKPASTPAPTPSPPKAKVAPPPQQPTPSAPAGAPAASGKRTFEFSDASSHKFWNIERSGTSLTVCYGRIGSAGQTQLKSFPDEAKAEREYDKLITEKTGKGYRETTPSAKAAPASMREALEQALVDNPDDLASHMAYADYLQEHGDPYGEFIRVQLALEDATRTPEERKALTKQESTLLDKHKEEWFGDLAEILFAKPKKKPEYSEPKVTCTLRRGWIDSLEAQRYTVDLTRKLAKAPQMRLLRRLVLADNAYESEGEYEAGPDIPEGGESPQLFPLVRCPYLGNVREFILGEVPTQKDEDTAHEGAFNCHTQGDGAVGVIKQMPRLEELRLFASNVDTNQLFSLKTLDHLRVLQVYHAQNYPLARLAKNSSLGKLTHLLLHPHAMDDEHPYIRTPAVKAVVTSPELKSLTHLQVRLSDMGDKGLAEIIASGILKRLKVLDLRHGCVTDAGAQRLAACADAKNLERLDLMNNALTDAGIAALKSAGVNVDARNQWRAGVPTDWGEDDNGYLFAGDIE